jgi:hypothetical protein
VSGQLHAPAALPLGNSPWYPLERRLGGPQSWSGQLAEKKILHPTGTQTLTPWCPAHSQSLCGLSYPFISTSQNKLHPIPPLSALNHHSKSPHCTQTKIVEPQQLIQCHHKMSQYSGSTSTLYSGGFLLKWKMCVWSQTSVFQFSTRQASSSISSLSHLITDGPEPGLVWKHT